MRATSTCIRAFGVMATGSASRPLAAAIIYGRSDATVNRYGIRMGTSEFYRLVEEFPEVADSLVVDLEFLGRELFLYLFVKMRDGAVLD